MANITAHKAPDLKVVSQITANLGDLRRLLAMQREGAEVAQETLTKLAEQLRDQMGPYMQDVGPDEIRSGLQWLGAHYQIDQAAATMIEQRIKTMAIEIATGGYSRLAFASAIRQIVRTKNWFPTVAEVLCVLDGEQEIAVAQNTLAIAYSSAR